MDSFEIPTNKYASSNVEKVELLPGSRAGELLLRMESYPGEVLIASVSLPDLLQAVVKSTPDLRLVGNVHELPYRRCPVVEDGHQCRLQAVHTGLEHDFSADGA